MAKKFEPGSPAKRQGRLKQIVASYQMTRKTDRWLGLVLAGTFLLVALLTLGLLRLVPPSWWTLDILTAVLVGLLGALIVFGRRAQKAAYTQIEGQPGAAAAALGMLRRGWKVDPAVAFNKNQDIVHRVVGPPGIVLVGEGNPQRLKTLLANERRKHERVTSETPLHEVVCGDPSTDPGAVPVSRLVRHVTKLGRNIKPAEMTVVLSRLKALDAHRSNIPLPKGPVATNMKGARSNMRGR